MHCMPPSWRIPQPEPKKETILQSAGIVSPSGWAIQVGAFSRTQDAEAAANHAIELAPADLSRSTVMISDEADSHASHRARLGNLTQEQAENACRKLSALHEECLVFQAD